MRYLSYLMLSMLCWVLAQGISFLDTLEPILESKSLPLRTVETVMMRWLEQLLRITDLTGPNPAQHLKFLLSKQHQVTRKYATKIKKCVSKASIVSTKNFLDTQLLAIMIFHNTILVWHYVSPPCILLWSSQLHVPVYILSH